MNKFLLLVVLCLPFMCRAQYNYRLENNVTGSYSTSKNGDQTSLVLNGINHVDNGRQYIEVNPYYSLIYSGKTVIDNEFLTREDIGIKDKSVSVFIVHQYNSSLIRSISSDNWIGLGIGKTFLIGKTFKFSISDCLENEYRKYYYSDIQTTVRNSLRAKIKFTYRGIQLSSEYFYQPNINDPTDINIFGTTTINIFEGKSVSFIIQNVYNFVSTTSVHVIQNTTFGLNIKIYSKKLNIND